MVIQILYEGTDITEVTNITRCVCRDVSHGRADSLELQFDHAAIWHLWAPKEDDKIIVNSDGYTTGTMYLNAIMPEGDGFRILATALPSAARRKEDRICCWRGHRHHWSKDFGYIQRWKC